MAKGGNENRPEALARRAIALVGQAIESMSRDAKWAKAASKRAKIASKEAIKRLPSALIRRSMEDAMQEHGVQKSSAKEDIESYVSARISVTKEERLKEENKISKKIKDATERAVRAAEVTKKIEEEARKIEEDVKKFTKNAIDVSDPEVAMKSQIYIDIAIAKSIEASDKIREVRRASEDAIMASEDVRKFLEEIKEMSGSKEQKMHRESTDLNATIVPRGRSKGKGTHFKH